MLVEQVLLLLLLLLLMLLLLFGGHKQDTFGIVTLRRSDARTMRNQLRSGTGTGQRGHTGGVAGLRYIAHRSQPLEGLRRGSTLRAVVVSDAIAGGR